MDSGGDYNGYDGSGYTSEQLAAQKERQKQEGLRRVQLQQVRQDKLYAMTPSERVQFLKKEKSTRQFKNAMFLGAGILVLAPILTSQALNFNAKYTAYDAQKLGSCVDLIEENAKPVSLSRIFSPLDAIRTKSCETTVNRYLNQDNPNLVSDNQLPVNLANKIGNFRAKYFDNNAPGSPKLGGMPNPLSISKPTM